MDGQTVISSLKQHIGQDVELKGWLNRSRASGKVQFLIVRDGTGLCQCVAEKAKIGPDLFAELKHLGQESSLAITGTVRADERSIGGGGNEIGRALDQHRVGEEKAATNREIRPVRHDQRRRQDSEAIGGR